MTDNYFLDMIETLRQNEEIILYGNMRNFEPAESDAVSYFLEKEYNRESWDYPFTAPGYDHEAGLWAAKTIYTAAQLMLHRENKPTDLESILPPYKRQPSPSAMLSCDLCLRFLPDMLERLKAIDRDDPLIIILEKLLSTWHYSGINYSLDTASLNFEPLNDACLRQLYINRIIEFKNRQLADLPALKDYLRADLGIFADKFWNNFSNSNPPYEQH